MLVCWLCTMLILFACQKGVLAILHGTHCNYKWWQTVHLEEEEQHCMRANTTCKPHLRRQIYLSALPYVESEIVMSYADTDFAIVPAAAPTLKNHLATSCPAPISAKTPYHKGFKFTSRACSVTNMEERGCVQTWCAGQVSRHSR